MRHFDIAAVRTLAKKAGSAVMEIYEGDHVVEYKKDNSPLTVADKASQKVIVAGLRVLTPHIPILSEEGRDIPYEERKHWQRFWLVDPLDGTKEFIKRNGEFTVNIALIEECVPVLGVIYAPVLDRLYFGVAKEGAWMQEGSGEFAPIRVRMPDRGQGLTVVMSRSHPSAELDQFLKTIRVAETISVGSSLKLCAVAEGKADLYPRLGPTMEWDTAAGQAIAEGAGAEVVRFPRVESLRYNKESLVNPYFLVRAKK